MFLKKRYILFVSLLLLSSLSSAALFQDINSSDFGQGTFYRTFYNSSGFVQLNISQNFLTGNFTSRIFDAGFNSTWYNISWFTELCYGCELPNNGVLETGNFLRPINMTGNVLLAHFNEGGGNIIDSSPYGATGIPMFFEGTEYNAAGKFNTALDFEKTGGVGPGELVNFSNPSQLTNFGNKITLEAWVSPEGYTGAPTIIDKDPSSFSMYFVATPNRLRVDMGSNTITSNGGYNVDTWYHIVFTYNGSTMNLYRNGILDATPVAATGNVATNNKALVIGSGWNGVDPNAFPFDGLIDEVAIYNRSLSAEEVKDHYIRGTTRINLSTRSCDDSVCLGENYSRLNNTSPQNITSVDNRYFQYKFDFITDNLTSTSKLYNVTIDYIQANPIPRINISYPLNNSNYTLTQLNLNYSVSDNDLSSCWYTTDNGLNNNTLTCGVNATGVLTSQGFNVWKLYANDTAGGETFASVGFFVDSLGPNINIVFPSNNSLLTNRTVYVNYTVIDSGVGLNRCWWTNSSGLVNTTLNCGTNFSFIGNEGTNLVRIYANDTFGNINSTVHTLNINTLAPTVTILSPLDNSVVGNLTNVNLNFSAIDPSLQACWYAIEEITSNITIASCQNTTFNLPGQGVYNIRVYANDSSGNIGYASSSFRVSVDAPSINPISPINRYFNLANSQLISFIYTPVDLDLRTCSLWTNANGSYGINQTNHTVISGQQNSFSLNMSNNIESSYLWAVSCNDSLGHNRITDNSTIYIDRTRPSVSLIVPNGTYASLSNIPITVDKSDASPVQCFYNVTFAATGNLVVGNSELLNCADTTFTLDTESSYFLWMMVNDSAGNTNLTRNTFTIDLPTPSGGGGSGGGGGGGGNSFSGGSVTGRSAFQVSLGTLEELEIPRGGSESIELTVRNSGLRFLNNCRFISSGGISEWISGEHIESLSPGQSTNYIFTVNVPPSAELGEYFVTMGVSCAETNSTFTYQIEVVGGEFELSILSSERIGTRLKANYAIENFGKKDKEISVNYRLIDEDGAVITEGVIDSINLIAGQRFEGTEEFELPKNSIGEYVLIMEASDGMDITQKQQTVRLARGGISGFAVSDANYRTIGWFGIVVLLGFGIFLVVKVIRKELAIKKANSGSDRQFITLDSSY